MKDINLGMIQMDIVKGDFEKNCQTVDRLISYRKQPLDVIMLPEMWSVGFDFRRMKKHGAQMDLPTAYLKQLAIKHNALVIGGSIPEQRGNRLFNSTLIINADGTIQDRYWKMHLVSQNNLEGKIFDRGNRIPKLFLDDLPFGVANCYDILFPELTRGIALNGSRMVFVVSQYTNASFHQWMTLLKARAMENQMMIAAVNRVGPNYFGHSCLISPKGEMLTEADDREQLVETSIPLSTIDDRRNLIFHMKQINYSALNKWVYPQNFIGVGGLVERGGRILMVRQNYGRLRGSWLLPGGHLEKDEPPEVGVSREIMEETGIETRALELLAVRNLRYKGVIDCYQVYRMDDLGGEPKPDGFENTEAAFLSPEEIFHEKPVTNLAKAIVTKYLSGDHKGLVLQDQYVSHSNDYQLYL
jgi:omega-amidase